jgi:hypothetical protein
VVGLLEAVAAVCDEWTAETLAELRAGRPLFRAARPPRNRTWPADRNRSCRWPSPAATLEPRRDRGPTPP